MDSNVSVVSTTGRQLIGKELNRIDTSDLTLFQGSDPTADLQ